MTLAGFVAYSGALALAAAIPGPGVTALVARALGSGFRASLFMSLGLILGDLIYLTAVVLLRQISPDYRDFTEYDSGTGPFSTIGLLGFCALAHYVRFQAGSFR